MTNEMCGRVRDLIPDFVASRLSADDAGAVERHVAGCGECRAEAEVARLVHAGRPRVPEGLLERVLESVSARRAQPSRAWWGISAAAVAALALGIGMSSHGGTAASVDVPGYAYETEEGEVWVSDDGLLAGAPSFDDLSDDALLQLLDELTVTSAGGSA